MAKTNRSLGETKTSAPFFSHNPCHCAFTQAAVTTGKTCHPVPWRFSPSQFPTGSNPIRSHLRPSQCIPPQPRAVTPSLGSRSTLLKGQTTHLLVLSTHSNSLTFGVNHIPGPVQRKGCVQNRPLLPYSRGVLLVELLELRTSSIIYSHMLLTIPSTL